MAVNRYALKAIRQKDGYSLKALAERVGCSLGTLHDIESGRRNASPSLTRQLAEALNVPISAIEVTAVEASA